MRNEGLKKAIEKRGLRHKEMNIISLADTKRSISTPFMGNEIFAPHSSGS
jgi:hypothetical protein